MPPPFASTGLTGRRLSVEEAGGWVNQFTNSRGDLGFVDIVANKNMSSLCVFVSACVEVGLSVVHKFVFSPALQFFQDTIGKR